MGGASLRGLLLAGLAWTGLSCRPCTDYGDELPRGTFDLPPELLAAWDLTEGTATLKGRELVVRVRSVRGESIGRYELSADGCWGPEEPDCATFLQAR